MHKVWCKLNFMWRWNRRPLQPNGSVDGASSFVKLQNLIQKMKNLAKTLSMFKIIEENAPTTNLQSAAKLFKHLRYFVLKISYLMQSYVINIFQVMIFRFYALYNKYEMIKTGNQRKISNIIVSARIILLSTASPVSESLQIECNVTKTGVIFIQFIQ